MGKVEGVGQAAPAFRFADAVTTTPHRTPFQRLANRLGRRFGIMPYPVTFSSTLPKAGDRDGVFAEIYDKNVWGSGESRSGPGSELGRTERYRRNLLDFLRRRDIRSMFDAPCGDLNWMILVLDQWPMDYSGGDISDVAIDEARKRRPGVDVRRFDICRDPFPKAHVWHCRDTLFHLSFADIWLALRNFASSDIELALITTNSARMMTNLDVPTGGFRYLDLERAPFFLPKAQEYLRDTDDDGFPRFVGVWPAEAISEAIERAAGAGNG
ncbi:MAG: class I SAM-dependent methyltransferase [Pseudomonadota bacterium]